MATTTLPSVFDINGLSNLKRQVKENSPEAIKAAAQQFEALFLQMVLKSMRDATPHEGIFDSEQSRMYQGLLDQQLSQVLSTKGGTGLAALIEKQMSRANADPQLLENLPLNPELPAFPLNPASPQLKWPQQGVSSPMPLSGLSSPDSAPPQARDFTARIWPYAYEASRATGIPAQFMVAQAALETGWGKSEPRFADGRPSFNLFGIKAGKNWHGAVVEATTTEHVNGVDQKQVERFRAYGSYAEAFRDYANLLQSNPRYAKVLGTQDAAAFARGLQQAGFATDPMYSSKLERIISGSTLRQSLSG